MKFFGRKSPLCSFKLTFFRNFSNRIRMYPSLVNCTTIDLFADWPHDALLEVGERYLSQIELAGDDKVSLIEEKLVYFSNILN